MKTIRIPRPDDWHVHLRDRQLLRDVVHETAHIYRRALVMPNTEAGWRAGLPDPELPTGGVLTARHVGVYREQITWELGPDCRFEPQFTIKITPATTPEIIREAKVAGVMAGKLYPDGVTTGSEGGVRDFEALWPVFAMMTECGMVLCLHGELPGVFCLDRETAFLPVLQSISNQYPRLKIVLEHVTTASAVELVKSLPNMAATITVHHLFLTLDDVIGGLLRPHYFCKPVAKRDEDRVALVRAATESSSWGRTARLIRGERRNVRAVVLGSTCPVRWRWRSWPRCSYTKEHSTSWRPSPASTVLASTACRQRRRRTRLRLRLSHGRCPRALTALYRLWPVDSCRGRYRRSAGT